MDSFWTTQIVLATLTQGSSSVFFLQLQCVPIAKDCHYYVKEALLVMDKLKTYLFSILLLALPLNSFAAQTMYFVHSDHNGTPQVLTDKDQNIVWKVESQTPFGETVVSEDPDEDGERITFNLRFPGQYYDKETGTNYNYFRTYDPSLGRYVQSDRLGLLDGSNTYSYVHSNPINAIDPTGEFAILGLVPWVVGGLGLGGLYLSTQQPAITTPSGNGLSSVPWVLNSQSSSGAAGSGAYSGAGGGAGSQQCPPNDPFCQNQQKAQQCSKSSAASSRVLSNNMQNAGMVRPANSAAHHMVAGNARGAAQARAALQRLGININSHHNGVFLPSSSRFAAQGQIAHSRIHTNTYYQTINQRLANANTGNVKQVLAQIRAQIQNGTFPY